MFKRFWSFLVCTLALLSSAGHVNCYTLNGMSWIFQGTAQQNNSALTFNAYDTLSLACRADVTGVYNYIVFTISKGAIPTEMGGISSGKLTLTGGTLIYSDINGIEAGFENFIINVPPVNSNWEQEILYEFRYLNIGVLKTTDAATYHCSGSYTDNPDTTFKTSGGLTINVNTQAGQGRSIRAGKTGILTYSAAILGASKLLF